MCTGAIFSIFSSLLLSHLKCACHGRFLVTSPFSWETGLSGVAHPMLPTQPATPWRPSGRRYRIPRRTSCRCRRASYVPRLCSPLYESCRLTRLNATGVVHSMQNLAVSGFSTLHGTVREYGPNIVQRKQITQLNDEAVGAHGRGECSRDLASLVPNAAPQR